MYKLSGIFKSVNSYITDFLLSEKMIFKTESQKYVSNITDTVFKYYYSWIYNNGTYFKLIPNLYPFTPTKESQKIVVYISQRSQISTIVTANILISLFKLVEKGVFPNNWLMASKDSAKKMYEFLDSNPTAIVNLLDNAFKQIKPLLSSGVNTIPEEIKNIDFTKITTPLIIVLGAVGFFLIKSYLPIKKNKDN